MKNQCSENLNKIQFKIDECLKSLGKDPKSVRLIGVSKKQDLQKIKACYQAGLQDFGENYVQEWQKKATTTADFLTSDRPLRWHFIGALQSNKVKTIVGQVEYIHTVDREKIAQKISERAVELNIHQKILAEINLADESSKNGFSPEEFFQALPRLSRLPNLSWEGLMAIPPANPNAESNRPLFEKLKSMLDECRQSGVLQGTLKELSMGMSNDYLVAISAGATMVRIGTALFGPRE